MANMSPKSPKRCLFGRPKPEEVDEFLEENLKKLQNEKIEEVKSKFGFDIEKNCSLKDSNWNWSKSTKGPEYFKFKVQKKTTVLKKSSSKNLKNRNRKLKNIENQIRKGVQIEW